MRRPEILLRCIRADCNSYLSSLWFRQNFSHSPGNPKSCSQVQIQCKCAINTSIPSGYCLFYICWMLMSGSLKFYWIFALLSAFVKRRQDWSSYNGCKEHNVTLQIIGINTFPFPLLYYFQTLYEGLGYVQQKLKSNN